MISASGTLSLLCWYDENKAWQMAESDDSRGMFQKSAMLMSSEPLAMPTCDR